METRLSEYRNLHPSACQQITDASLRLAQGLTPGIVPEPEQIPPRGPFAIGTNPPELE